MKPRPETRYVWSGAAAVAYQVFGDGPVDLIFIPPHSGNVEWQWHVPPLARFLERLASFARVIVFDRRGTGCSDRLGPDRAATLEEHVDDVLAVMGGAASPNAVIFGSMDSAFVAMLAAAAHPDRFRSMILFGATPAWTQSEDLPWEWSQDRWGSEIEMVARLTSVHTWLDGFMKDVLPSMRDDEVTAEAVGSLVLLSQAPGASIAEMRALSGTDLREILPAIRVPSLVLHRPDEQVSDIRSARYVAEHLADARFVELPGADAFPWGHDVDALLGEVEEFVVGTRQAPAPERMLATVLFTDIVESTALAAELGDRRWKEVLEAHQEIVRSALAEHRGREVDTAGDGFFAVFDGPARAVQCARAIAERVRVLGIEVRSGVHTGEVERSGNKVSGIGVHIGARVAALAGPSETLVTSTVRHLVAGSGLEFEDRGAYELKGVPEPWQVFSAVTDRS